MSGLDLLTAAILIGAAIGSAWAEYQRARESRRRRRRSMRRDPSGDGHRS